MLAARRSPLRSSHTRCQQLLERKEQGQGALALAIVRTRSTQATHIPPRTRNKRAHHLRTSPTHKGQEVKGIA
eukprot:scaffold15004_cov130-Isochrysis_galbana.AAC.1